MTEALKTSLLLDKLTVHGPMVEISCNLLAEQPIAVAAFHGAITPARDSGADGELLPFLLESGLVQRARGNLLLSRSYCLDWSPRLNLLHLLHTRRDVNYTFRFIWEALIDRPEWAGCFINRDDVWPVINQTRHEGLSLPQLNSNRMASWLRLASWIGLIQPERSNSFCVIPTESLVLELLATNLGAAEEVALSRLVADVEAQFCCLTTSSSDLHPGFAAVLGLLRDDGRVELKTYSDAQLYQVGRQRVSHVVFPEGVTP